MKLILTLFLLVLSFFANSQNRDKLYIGIQIQPEVTFYKSGYYSNAYPANSSKSSINAGFNIYGAYNLSDRLFITVGLGYTSRRLNTSIILNQASLPYPYTDSFGTVLMVPHVISYRTLQTPIGLGYNFTEIKKTVFFTNLTIIPNFLLKTKYGTGSTYPAFKKNYLQGLSINPGIGLTHNLSRKIKLNAALTYSLINTVKEEEYADKTPKLKHAYLQLCLGAKIKLK